MPYVPAPVIEKLYIQGKFMSKEEIKSEIDTLRREFEQLMRLLDESLSNINSVSEGYSELIKRVNSRLKELQKLQNKDRLSDLEVAFLLPCINEVSLHCEARIGSKNTQELASSIYDGQDYCSYWLSQLNV